MATGWAVGSATLLAFVAAGIALIGGQFTHEVWYAFFAFVPFFAVWVYAIAMAAHGSRTAIVALAGHTTLAGIAIPYLEWSSAPLLQGIAVITALVAGLTLWALIDEARHRGGRIHLGTLFALLLPVVVTGFVVWAANLKLAILGQ